MAEIIQKVQSVIGGIVGPIKVGDKLATGVKLKEHSVTNANVDLDNTPGKIIIVGVPGAFTSTCSTQVPGYVKNLDAILAKGVSDIYVVAVNDQFVMEAWKEKLGAADSAKVHFLADDAGKFTSAIGMSFDAGPILGNARSKRYVLLVQDGIVKELELEDDLGQVTVTKADNFMAKL